MSFEKYSCFRLPDLNQVANRYAEHEKSDALFLTTHAKSVLLDESNKKIIHEQELLESFMKSSEGQDTYRIFVLKGNTGSGKSHLVKWLHTKQPKDKNFWPVYIDKANTHLRAVIEKTIEGLDGKQFENIRGELDRTKKLYSGIDEAKVRVLNTLASNIEFADVNNEPKDAGERQARKLLPKLLIDPELRSEFLKEDGVIHYACQLELEDNKEDVDEARLKFHKEDLEVISHQNYEALKGVVSESAKKVLTLLNNPEFSRVALSILNDEMNRTKRYVFIGDAVTLGEVFRKVRFELKKENKELVFYVEEFVHFQGIDKELADALITNEEGLCGLRAVIAVTAGFWEENFTGSTFATRSRQLSLDLDENQRPKEKSSHHSCTYVAGYLNALRLGIEKIEAQKESIKSPDWQPQNACLPCEHRESCHATFGKTEDDIGFYPYNENAIINISKIANEESGTNEEVFNPRANLLYLIGDSDDGDQVKGLRVAIEELPKGEFPSEEFASFANRTNVELRLRNELKDNQRRLSLLNFWHKNPADSNQITEDCDLEDGIHTAFDLPKIGKGIPIGAADSSVSSAGSSPAPLVEDSKKEVFDSWSEGERTLPQDEHLTIRTWIHSSIVETIRDGPYDLWAVSVTRANIGNKLFPREKVVVESAQGGGDYEDESETGLSVKIPCNGVMAELIFDIYSFGKSGKWPSVESYVKVKEYINGEVEKIVKKAKFSNSKKDYLPYLELLAVSAQPKLKNPDENLMVGVINGFSELDEEGNTEWKRWVKATKKLRIKALKELQSRFGGSKRVNVASFLDVAEVLPSLEKFRESKSLKAPPESFKDYEDFNTFINYQEQAFEKTWQKVSKYLEQIDDLTALEDAAGTSDVKQLVDRIRPVINRAGEAGIGLGDPRELERQSLLLEDSCLENAKKLLGLADPGAGDIWELVPDPLEGLHQLQIYLKNVQDVFDNIQKKLDEQTSGDEEVSLNQLLAQFDDFDSNIEAIDEMLEDGDLWGT